MFPTDSVADGLRAWKDDHPGAVVVSYVNTTAAVKHFTDICCTSSNAVEGGRVIPADREVLFCRTSSGRPRAPDDRPQEPASGPANAALHAGINGDELAEAGHPTSNAELFVHPDAVAPVGSAPWPAAPREQVKILSTGGMLDAARSHA